MLSGVLKPDDKPVSICIHLIVSSFICLVCFLGTFSEGCDRGSRRALSIPVAHRRSRLRNTRRRSKVADLLSSHTLTGSGWANPLFTGQFQKKLIVTGRALYLICGHSSLKKLLCTVCYSPLCSVSKLLRLARPQLRVSAVRVRTCIRKR